MNLATEPRAGAAFDITAVGAQSAAAVLTVVGVSPTAGPTSAAADARRLVWGRNAVTTNRARFCPSRPPDALSIVVSSIGLGFIDEYRAEKAAQALHDQIRRETSSCTTADRRGST